MPLARVMVYKYSKNSQTTGYNSFFSKPGAVILLQFPLSSGRGHSNALSAAGQQRLCYMCVPNVPHLTFLFWRLKTGLWSRWNLPCVGRFKAILPVTSFLKKRGKGENSLHLFLCCLGNRRMLAFFLCCLQAGKAEEKLPNESAKYSQGSPFCKRLSLQNTASAFPFVF